MGGDGQGGHRGRSSASCGQEGGWEEAVTLPDRSVVATTHGYHPLVGDAAELLSMRLFSDVLVLGPGVPDVGGLAQQLRHLATPPVQLPEGIYWFSGVTPAAVLVVDAGGPPGAPLRE